MDETLKPQIEIYLNLLDGLIRRGRQLRQSLAAENSNGSAIAALRAWQEDCGTTINQLSGGSKAHWLARSFSQAFLMRSANGGAVAAAAPAEIVDRLIAVLEQATSSLSQMDASEVIASSAASQLPPPRRFEFVHNPELRPVVEQAFIDGRRAFEQGHYDEALRTACGILESIVTDAIEHLSLEANGSSVLASAGAPAIQLADWPFATRLAVAEKVGLIRGGCARLPAVARSYRDHENGPQTLISERDAQQTAQVLRVVMRDLDPGR